MFTIVTDNNAQALSDEEEMAAIDQDRLFKEISDSLDANIFLFSGPVERPQANLFLDIAERAAPRENAALILCTHGGDADAAYIIARFLRRTYKKFFLYVFGHCKSAGTLIALGADEIIMSSRGELGPLDVQLLKADDLFFRGSGLEIEEAVTALSDQAFDIFEKHFLGIIRRGGGSITTKTAADIAGTLAVGLLAPITGQIDPLHVGEVKRAINIAYEYGIRLNTDENRINRLVSNYPSHSFVIDYEEAKQIFESVRLPSDAETKLEQILQSLVDDQGRRLVRHPDVQGLVAYLKPRKETADEQNPKLEKDAQQDTNEAPKSDGSGNKTSKKDVSELASKVGQGAQKAESVNSKNGQKRRIVR